MKTLEMEQMTDNRYDVMLDGGLMLLLQAEGEDGSPATMFVLADDGDDYEPIVGTKNIGDGCVEDCYQRFDETARDMPELFLTAFANHESVQQIVGFDERVKIVKAG